MRQLENQPQIEGCYKPRAGARTPMQWGGGKNLGFSTADASKLYLPMDSASDAPNVAAEEKDPNSLLNRVRKLIRLKHTEPALAAYAEFVPLYAKENAYPFVYARAGGDEILLVILNPAASAVSAEFSFPVECRELKLLAGKEVHTVKAGQTLKIEVPGQTYAIYQAVK
jgi:maltose alpha-D-glucosyltransferase/alpha-amylase